jgi:tetratricopeptide (TPR) repeat protein
MKEAAVSKQAGLVALVLVALTGCASGGGGRVGSSGARPATTAARVSCQDSPEIAARAEAARSAAREGRYDEALRVAEEVLQACAAQPVAVAALGQALVEMGRLDEAIARLTAVLQANPDLGYAYYWRGKAYNARQQTARMVDDLEAFLRLLPNAPEAAAVQQLLSAIK